MADLQAREEKAKEEFQKQFREQESKMKTLEYFFVASLLISLVLLVMVFLLAYRALSSGSPVK